MRISGRSRSLTIFSRIDPELCWELILKTLHTPHTESVAWILAVTDNHAFERSACQQRCRAPLVASLLIARSTRSLDAFGFRCIETD